MKLAVPVTISVVLFTVYLLVDLYFVGRLGPDAVAALSISSNAFFIHYLRIFSIGFVMVGTIMVASSAFQGLGQTYPSLIGAVVDNALFAGLVFTLPVYFSWGIQAVWWIKLGTAAAETAVVTFWLKHELAKVRSRFDSVHRPAGLLYN
ncbi:MAG: MATE family efflux transporter [Desulfobacteraceae bacterium]|nr:MATE family efflux transporter [Desulfobacteraceae bacterium]